MKKFKRLVALMLVLVILSTSLQIQVFAQSEGELSSVEQVIENKDSRILGEVVEKRERNVKHFLKDDMTFEAAIYPTSVHFMEKDQWVDVDNTLEDIITDDKEEVLQNKNNEYKIKLAKKADSKKLVNISKGKYEISWNIDGADKVKAEVSPIE